jgi:serine/threonine protein kinase
MSTRCFFQKNDSYIALKKVKSTIGEIDAEKRSRWISEVSIMKKLDHINVVSAFETPSGIERLIGGDMGLPVLCMEYCSGGSLRKVCAAEMSIHHGSPTRCSNSGFVTKGRGRGNKTVNSMQWPSLF